MTGSGRELIEIKPCKMGKYAVELGCKKGQLLKRTISEVIKIPFKERGQLKDNKKEDRHYFAYPLEIQSVFKKP